MNVNNIRCIFTGKFFVKLVVLLPIFLNSLYESDFTSRLFIDQQQLKTKKNVEEKVKPKKTSQVCVRGNP